MKKMFENHMRQLRQENITAGLIPSLSMAINALSNDPSASHQQIIELEQLRDLLAENDLSDLESIRELLLNAYDASQY